MSGIESIICFNGGSAGDMLKGLCLANLNQDQHYVDHNGMVELVHDFKDMCQQLYYNPSLAINLSNCSPVENTHYWLEIFPTIARHCWYINYDDNINGTIVDEFIRKRNNNDLQVLIDRQLRGYPEKLLKKINPTNARTAFCTMWLRSLHSWRQNPQLIAIEFADFFDIAKLKKVVAEVSGSDIVDHSKFEKIYYEWLNKNQILQQLF